MKTRYGVSPWVHQFPASRRPALPRLHGEHEADVVVVGGGLAGCAVAYSCAVAGLKAILVEADRVGSGGAGRSAGLLLPEPGPLFRDVAAAHGLRSARRAFEIWRRTSLEAAALIRRLNIRAGLEPLSSVIVTHRDGENRLRREFDARRNAGVDVSWLMPRQVGPATGMDLAGGLRQRDAFAVDPYRLCLGLAAAAAARKARLYERTAVRTVKFTRKDALIVTADAAVRTARVVVATGTATAEWAQLRRHFKRRETYLALTQPMPAAMRKEVGPRNLTFRDLAAPRHRVRWTSDHRIVVAGGDQDQPPDRLREATRIQRTGQLMYELLTMYPAISGLQPEYGWELAYGDTADGLMYIGPHRNYPHHLFALGGATDSITGAFLAAKLVTRAAAGAAEKDDEIFGFNR